LLASIEYADRLSENLPMVTYDTAISMLLETFPEMPEEYIDRDWVELNLPHLVYGHGGFASWILDLLREGDDGRLTRRCFDYLEWMANQGPEARALVTTGVLENLTSGWDASDVQVISWAEPYLGPYCHYLLASILVFWEDPAAFNQYEALNPWPWPDDSFPASGTTPDP